MSLRVLLADESDTIKKVFQLALQDLSAEIKSVHSGLDVIDVAQTFKPDIIFADVLLQKKNGYDTCHEIKHSPQLAKTPVVLMWSSFMELDQAQFKKSKADDQLEKPFDADFLRELIKKYAPQTQENPLGQFLNFPKGISKGLKAESKPQASVPSALTESPQEDTSEFNIAAFLDEQLPGSSENSQLKMPNAPIPNAPPQAPDESWLSADLSKFKLDLEAPSDNLEKFEAFNLGEGSKVDAKPLVLENLAHPPQLPSLEITTLPPMEKSTPKNSDSLDDDTSPSIIMPSLDLDESLPQKSMSQRIADTKTKAPPSNTNSLNKNQPKTIKTLGLDDNEIEAIIRAHTEEVIKTQIKETLVDIIEKIVRDELSKLLDEEVRLKQDTID